MNRNDLFYLCSLLESISRNTGLSKKEIIQIIGEKQLRHLYNVASVNHSLPIEQVTQEVIDDFNIPQNNLIKIKNPSIWELGNVYQRLIEDVSNQTKWFEKMIEVYNSWICYYIDDYKKPIYCQPRSYIRECYLQNEII